MTITMATDQEALSAASREVWRLDYAMNWSLLIKEKSSSLASGGSLSVKAANFLKTWKSYLAIRA